MSEKARVLELIRSYGWNATAFQTLESGFSYHFTGDDSCVAYTETRGAWVAAGPPIAPDSQLADSALQFLAAARRAGKRACFFGTEQRFHDAVGPALASLQIGEQPEWEPSTWPELVANKRNLREQLRRARNKGVRVRQATREELETHATRRAMASVAERWLASRRMAPLEFLVHLDPFTFPDERVCFLAERDGLLIGFAAAIPVPARDGWFLEDLVRDPTAPNGTSELLVDAVMRWALDAQASWLTLGLVPLAGDIHELLRFTRDHTRLLYDFEGLRAYKAKLRPSSWSPIYLAYPSAQSEWLSLFDALTAFTGDRPVRFALQTLLLRSRRLWLPRWPSMQRAPC